jgi:hypothetical protein
MKMHDYAGYRMNGPSWKQYGHENVRWTMILLNDCVDHGHDHYEYDQNDDPYRLLQDLAPRIPVKSEEIQDIPGFTKLV